MSPRVLVTGAAGFIGRHVVEQLRTAGASVVAVDHRWSGREELDALLGAAPVDRCIHLAWDSSAASRASGRRQIGSLRSGLQVASALTARGCRHLVAVGSGAEYSPQESPITEHEPVDPEDAYTAVKCAFREVLSSTLPTAGCGVTWLRAFGAFGPGDAGWRVLPFAARGLLRGDVVQLTSGEQRMDFPHVRDVAAGIVAASGAELRGDFNVSTGEPHRLRHVLESLADRLGDRRLLRFGALPARPGERAMYSGDSRKLAGATGWAPRVSLDELLEEIAAERPVTPQPAGGNPSPG